MWVNKEDLTLKDWASLSSTEWIIKGINYDEIKYFKEDNGKVWEIGYCTDGSLDKRIKELEKVQEVRKILNTLGFR